MCIPLRTRHLVRLRYKTLRRGRKVEVDGRWVPDWNQEAVDRLDDDHRRELLWLIYSLPLWNGKEILPLPPHFEVATDAAKTIGGGLVLLPSVGADQATALPQEARWLWHPWELHLSINAKELVSPELGLRALDKMFSDLVYDARILCNTDSTTALRYINKQGGSLPHLSRLAERLWHFCLRRGCTIFCRHLAGVHNTRADRASRHRGDRSEWQLLPNVFKIIEDAFGPHSVDLMASRTNHLLPRYFSRWGDPGSAGPPDALQHDWALEGNPYCHPPYIMIPLVLRHLVATGAEITLVAPVWPAHFWITMLVEFSVSMPVLLPRELLRPTLPQKFPPEQPRWRTAAWRLCARPSSAVAFTRQQWQEFFASGVHQR